MALLDEIQFRVYRSYVKIPLIFFVPLLTLLSVYSLAYFHVNSQPFWRTVEVQLEERLGGKFSVGYMKFNWSLTAVELHDVVLRTPVGERVIEADKVNARITPLMLATRRLEFEQGRVDGARIRIAFDDGGELNLLQVFGIYERQRAEDRGEEGSRLAVGFSDLAIHDADFEFVDKRFDFSIDDIDIPSASVFIEPTTVLMNVEALDIDRADFRFKPEMFSFHPDRGDWEFTVRDFELRNWRWANNGFTVERFSGDVDGIQVEAGGRMAFPGAEAQSSMFYDARGTISAVYHSRLLEYFTGGNIRFDIPSLDLEIEGDLNQIRGAADVHAKVVMGNGLFFEDLRGQVVMDNRFILADEITGRFYGGDLRVENAFFNILETFYGADLEVSGSDPRALVRDLVGQDQPFIEGALDGKLRIIGEIPSGPQPGVGYGYALMNSVNARFAQMEVLETMTLRRSNDLLFPNQRLDLRPGSTFWVDQRRLGLPHASLVSGADRVEIRDFFLETGSMYFDFPGGTGPATYRVSLAEIAPYATYYGLDGLEGAAEMTMTMEGYFGSPRWSLQMNMEEPAWRMGEELLAGESLQLHLEGEDGDIDIERAHVNAGFGIIDVKGRAGWFEPPPKPGAPQPWPVWEDRTHQPLELEIDMTRLSMEVFSPMIHEELDALGFVDGRMELSGTTTSLLGGFEARLNDGVVRGQPVVHAQARGAFEAGGVRIEEAEIDLGPAGHYQGKGRYGYNGEFNFAMEGEDIELAELRELDDLPMKLGGKSRFHMTGKGDLENPIFAAGAHARDLSVDGRVYGDVALTADTIDDIVYISGGLLPWLTASIEIPLKGPAPFYARMGMEELELMAFLPELQENEMLDAAQLTGMTELFFERDFSRYQAIFYLTDLEIDSRGQILQNRGPVIVGYNNGEVLTFQRATLGSAGRYFSLEGGIAFDPALLDLRLEGDFDLSLLHSVRAGFPDYFPDFFVGAEGYVLMDMNVRGTPENFVADGTINFGPSEWELRFLPEPVALRAGRMVFGDHGIRIPGEHPLEATLLGGETRIAGDIGYLSDQERAMDLRMWSHNMSYRIPDLATLAFDTNLRMEASDWQDWESWLISGELNILDGVYTQTIQFVEHALAGRVLGAFQRRADRYEASLFELVPILNDINFDMYVRARDGFRLQSNFDRLEMDLEFRFDLLLRDTLANPRVRGDVDVIGGDVTFQGESFEVRSGSVRFSDDISNPYLDIVAGADVRNTCRESDFIDDVSPTMTLASNLDATGMQYYHIIMNIRGELANLDLHMESNPYADQRDILSLLLTGCTVDQLTASSASRPTLEIALGPLLGRLEREIQDVVAFEEFTIMPGVERTQVRLGAALTRQLSWRSQIDTGFSDATGGGQYQLEYKLSDNWSGGPSVRHQTQTNNVLIDLNLIYRLPLD